MHHLGDEHRRACAEAAVTLRLLVLFVVAVEVMALRQRTHILRRVSRCVSRRFMTESMPFGTTNIAERVNKIKLPFQSIIPTSISFSHTHSLALSLFSVSFVLKQKKFFSTFVRSIIDTFLNLSRKSGNIYVFTNAPGNPNICNDRSFCKLCPTALPSPCRTLCLICEVSSVLLSLSCPHPRDRHCRRHLRHRLR